MQTHTHMKHTHKKTQTQSLTHGISPLDITHSHTHSQTQVMGSLSVVSRQVLRTDTRGTRVCVSVGTSALLQFTVCTVLYFTVTHVVSPLALASRQVLRTDACGTRTYASRCTSHNT